MDAPLVCYQIAPLGKAFIALLALKRFLTRMGARVYGQSAFCYKVFIALLALIRSLARMSTQMYGQSAFCCKALIALATIV